MHVRHMTKVDDNNDDTLSFVRLATAIANVLTYLRTGTNPRASELEEKPDRSSKDANASAEEKTEEEHGHAINRDLHEIGFVTVHACVS